MEDKMAFCSNCGGKIEDDVKFCSGCGKAVSNVNNEPAVPICSSCGKKLEEGVRFCSNCGNTVGGVPSTPVITAPTVTPVANTQGAVQIQSATADEKYCFSCGSVIKKAAEICPKCGVNQNSRSSTAAIDVYCTSCGKSIKKDATACPFCGVTQGNAGEKNKTTAILLCLFTGVGHRFYTGKTGTAIVMLLLIFSAGFFWGLGMELGEELIGVGVFIYLGYFIWWLIDLISIGRGKFRDKQDNLLKKS